VLLARGARLVVAVDVGRGQLHQRLRQHPQVMSLEATDVRNLEAAQIPERADLVTIDVSFISLKLVLHAALTLAKPSARMIALIKPQFEAGRAHVKKGVVRDDGVRAAVCEEIASFVRTLGWRVDGTIASPIAGGDGNREFLIGASR
jgi:23S rRNA (cytidine1920-2'-O)/16S rRNA (cytidine1409-2'-O)-methyltransferase